MKGKKLIFILVIISMFVVLSLVIIISFSTNKGPTPKKLDAPIVTLDENFAKWTKIDFVVKYEISIDGNLSYLEENVLSIKLEYNQSFKVRAIGDGKNYLDSDWSNIVICDYEVPPINKYTVIWLNNGEILEIDYLVEEGTIPTYDGQIPTQKGNNQYTYIFSGWSPEISPLNGDTTYIAQFTSVINKYTVSFYDEFGENVLFKTEIPYGGKAEYTSIIPSKEEDDNFTYEFEKWVTNVNGNVEANLSNITSDLNVYPSFKAVSKKVKVTFIVNNDEYGKVSETIIENICVGTVIQIVDNTIIIDDFIVFAIPTASNSQYKYLFDSWSSKEVVEKDTIIVANFSRTIKTYTVLWMSEDKILEVDNNVEYGTTPVYDGKIPTKESLGDVSYVFVGWNPKIYSVDGDITYIAVFDDVARKFSVKFIDYNDTLIEEQFIEVGNDAIPPINPIREGFEFVGWSENYCNIYNDVEIKAIYSDSKNIFNSKIISKDSGTIKILIELCGTVKICGFDLSIQYDNNILELKNYNADLELDIIVNNNSYEDKILLNYSGVNEKTVQRDIIELTFEFKTSIIQETIVNLNVLSAKELNDSLITNSEYKIINCIIVE